MFRRLLALSATAACVTTAASDTPASAASRAGCAGAGIQPAAHNLVSVRTATRCLINRERARHGLRRLRPALSLRAAATGYARHMAREDFFAHVSPGGSTMLGRIRRTAYLDGARSWSVGENLAWGAGSRATPRQIVRVWMDSPPHRANILRADFRHLGIGLAVGAPVHGVAGGVTYVTEFGRRS